MNEDLLFRLLLIVVYGLFASIRIYYRTRSTAPKQSEAKEREGINKIGGVAGITMSIGVIGMLISVILYLIALPWLNWSQLPIPSLIRWIGIGLGISSLPLIIWIHRTLGKYYSAVLELKEEHILIKWGPYSRIRHPMYTTFIIFALSIALISANLFVIAFCILIVISFPSIAKQEEQMLIDLFGDEYRNYIKQTGRFFPRIRQQKEDTKT
ncbi:MAG: isoprenylcysteine carboxylmethyltransferase family protein [Promethearchaeota archaeon]